MDMPCLTSPYIFGMPVLKIKSGNFLGLRLQPFEVIIYTQLGVKTYFCKKLAYLHCLHHTDCSNTGCLKETVHQHHNQVEIFVSKFRVFFLSVAAEQDLLSHLTSCLGCCCLS